MKGRRKIPLHGDQSVLRRKTELFHGTDNVHFLAFFQHDLPSVDQIGLPLPQLLFNDGAEYDPVGLQSRIGGKGLTVFRGVRRGTFQADCQFELPERKMIGSPVFETRGKFFRKTRICNCCFGGKDTAFPSVVPYSHGEIMIAYFKSVRSELSPLLRGAGCQRAEDQSGK